MAGVDPGTLVRVAARRVEDGGRVLHVRCSEYARGGCDAVIPCHGGWDALLFSCIAAEGIRVLRLHGTTSCMDCHRRFGLERLRRSMEVYGVLSRGMEVMLEIEVAPPAVEESVAVESCEEVSARRRFFRQLLPTIARGAVTTVAQISKEDQSTRGRQEEGEEEGGAGESGIPVRLRLFVQALRRLRPSFTPVPASLPLPLGAVQADDRCTACGDCVADCPTSALRLRRFGGDRWVLEFQPDVCVGCHRCVRLCPEQAISMLPGVSLPVIAARNVRPLVMVTVGAARGSTDNVSGGVYNETEGGEDG